MTEQALAEAKAVVVLWSKKSVESRWVRAEATQADRNGTLLPAMIEACKRPIMFELVHTAELEHWKGDPADPAFAAFLADVKAFVGREAGPAASQVKAAPSPAPRPLLARRGVLMAGAAGVVALASGLGWLALAPRRSPGSGPSSEARFASVAVLPFEDRTQGGGQEFLAEGLAVSLLDRLARNRALRVPASTSTFAFRGKGVTTAEIARELNVETVLEGSVAREGDRVRIRAALSEAASGRQIWSETYDRDLTQLAGMFALQDEITAAIARELQASLGLGPQRAEARPANSEAWEAFLEGKALMARGSTESALQAEDAFARAIAADPGFAPAHARLALALLYNPNDLRPGRQDRARQAIDRAFALDPDLPDAILAQAQLATFSDTADISQALDRLEQLLADDPANAEALAVQVTVLRRLGRFRAAQAGADALLALDPVGVDATVAAAWVLQKTGRAADAPPLLTRALRLHPQDARLLWQRTQAQMYAGDYPALARAAVEALEQAPGDFDVRSRTMFALGWAGHGEEALALAPDAFYQTSAWASYTNQTTPPPLSLAEAAAMPIALQRALHADNVRADPAARLAAWEAVQRDTPNVNILFLGPRGHLVSLLAARRDAGDGEGVQALAREIREFHRQLEAEGWAGYERDRQKLYLAAALGDRQEMYRRWDAAFASGIWYAAAPSQVRFDSYRNEPEFKARVRRFEAEQAKARAFLEREGLLARTRAVIQAQGWTPDPKPL